MSAFFVHKFYYFYDFKSQKYMTFSMFAVIKEQLE